MTRLQTMVDFLRPISSIMISLGDGGWKATAASNSSSDQIPSLNSFDVGADGKQIFAHYSIDTIDSLLTALEQKGKPLLKGKQALGVFLAKGLAQRLFGVTLNVLWWTFPVVCLSSAVLAVLASIFPVGVIRGIRPAVVLKGE